MSRPDPSQPPASFNWTASVVAILGRDGKPAGTGFVIDRDQRLIATCAHVLHDAGWQPSEPDQPVQIRFYALRRGNKRFALARSEMSLYKPPGEEDIAVLRVDQVLPAVVSALSLASSYSAIGEIVYTHGFPKQYRDGLQGVGSIVGIVEIDGFARLQLSSLEITRGYSGGPLWSVSLQSVLGIVHSGRIGDEMGRLKYTAFGIPAETIARVVETGSDHPSHKITSHATKVSLAQAPLLEQGKIGNISTLSGAKGNQWVSVFSKGTPFLDQIYVTERQFPKQEIQRNASAGYHITDIAFGAGRWVVVLSKGSGRSEQSLFVRRTFPHADISRKLERGYRITNFAYGRGYWVIVFSKGNGFSAQSCHIRQGFPTPLIKSKRHSKKVTGLSYGGGYWAVALTKGSGYASQKWWATSQFPSDDTSEYIEDFWRAGYRITSLVYGDGLWAIMASRGSHYDDQIWHVLRTMPNDAVRRLRNDGWFITCLSYGPV